MHGVGHVCAGLLRHATRLERGRPRLRSVSKRDLFDIAKPERVLAGGLVSSRNAAASGRDVDDASPMRAMLVRNALPGRERSADTLRRGKLGRRRQLRHGMQCAYPLCSRSARVRRGHGVRESDMHRLFEWHLQRDGERNAVQSVVVVRGRVLRERIGLIRIRPLLRGMSFGHVHERSKPSGVPGAKRVLRRHRRDRACD